MMVKFLKLTGILLISFSLLMMPLGAGHAGEDTWTPSGPYGVEIWTITASPSNPQRMYAGTDMGLYQSDDGGINWVQVNGLPPGTIYEIVIYPADPSLIYLASSKGVFASRNGSLSWTQTNLQVGVMSLAVDPYNPLVLYAGSMASLLVYKSVDGGDSWITLDLGGLGNDVRAIVIDPDNSQVVYAAGSGIYKSLDGGETWENLNLNLSISSLSLRRDHSQILYAGVFGGGLFTTDNGGGTWIPVGNAGSLDVRDVMADPINPGRLYLAVLGNSAGVYRSDDNGQTWVAMLSGMGERNLLSVYVNSQTPQTIYAGSTNSGIWSYTLTSALKDFSLSINSGALYTNSTAVTLTLTAPPGTNQMLISNDGGFSDATWESFSEQKPWTISSYGSYVLPRIVYAKFKTNGTVSGLYQDDIVLDVNPPQGSVAVLPASAQVFQVAPVTAGGVLTYTLSLPLLVKNYHPGYTTIELQLTASDDISGVGEVIISTSSDFFGSTWQPYKEQLSWFVPQGESGVIYAKFRDRAGNISTISSANW